MIFIGNQKARRGFPCSFPEQGMTLAAKTKPTAKFPIKSHRVFLVLLFGVVGVVMYASTILKTPIRSFTKMAVETTSEDKGCIRNVSRSIRKENISRTDTNQTNTETESFTQRNTSHHWCSGWHNYSGNMTKEKYFLTAVVLVRIYASDINHFTTRELVQWLQYLTYAGVEHVYVYDSFLYKNESQKENLQCFIENGYVTYVNWSHTAREDVTLRPNVAQQPAYQHCLTNYRHQFTWQTSVDIDEYPYCPNDHAPGFLSRVVKKTNSKQKGKLGVIYMSNFLFLGKPLNVKEHPILIDRQWRRIRKPWSSQTVKPVYLSEAVKRPMVHKPRLHKGFMSVISDPKTLRMNHYHGERQKAKTQEDTGMKPVVSALKACLEDCQLGCC